MLSFSSLVRSRHRLTGGGEELREREKERKKERKKEKMTPAQSVEVTEEKRKKVSE